MTTNQTIDGVPRELRELLERVATEANHMLGFTYAANYDECRSAVDELRALLDAPADPRPTGLSQGWNLTRKHDGFVVGHQSVAYPPDGQAIERAEREGYVWIPFLVPASQLQPQGEPVAWRGMNAYGEVVTDWVDGRPPDSMVDLCGNAAMYDGIELAYAEQPAPVAAVLPNPIQWHDDYSDTRKSEIDGWNACLDELARLNTPQ